MVSPPHVYILTWCQDMTAFYGTELVFQTLRIGFPSAQITVVDNGSLPEACARIALYAQACDAEFVVLPTPIHHTQFLSNVLSQQETGGVVFLNPDVCFWESVEDWQFPTRTLLAGRRIPAFWDAYTQSYTHSRLHTSLLWVPDVQALGAEISRIRRTHFEFAPFMPVMWREGEHWQRLDTGASLYAALAAHSDTPERLHAFTERELNAYDQLFCSTHLAPVAGGLDAESATWLRDVHRQASEDYRLIRGVWRAQEAFFACRANPPQYPHLERGLILM